MLTNFVIAICLLLLGLVIGGYLAWCLASPALELMRGSKGISKLKKAAARVERADALMAEEKPLEALKALRASFVFTAAGSIRAVDNLRDHHQNLLSRCLVIAEELESKPENIAEVERLLLERSELQHLYIKALESFHSLKQRREKAGKDVADWSKADFKRRVSEVEKELQANEQLLNAALNTLFKALANPKTENIVYH